MMVPNENASCHKMARREMARRKTSGTEELMGAMGIRSLRPGQREAITSIVDGRSTLFVSPTGSGKSLVYQAAAKELPGTGIVVSPLNSLILDQYQQACKYFKGTVDIVNGTRTPTERQAIYSRFGKGLKLLFISPEMFVRLFQVCPSTLTHVSFVTFDEGDTAIQWGERFRADYHRAALIAVRLLCPILVLTATLSKRRLPRMLMHFDIDANNVVWAPSARTNVGHRFVHCEAMANADAMLINIISRCDDGNAAIVYVLRREHADKVHDLLVKHVPPSRPVFKYRGGMPEPVRERQQLGWEQHQSAIMVATVAFSLGINRMDVGLIVQYGLPSSPMDFVQQAGRAARRPDSNGQCVTICCKEIDAQQLSNIQRCYLEETVVKDHVRDICAAGDHGGALSTWSRPDFFACGLRDVSGRNWIMGIPALRRSSVRVSNRTTTRSPQQTWSRFD
ncbi:hypothetical protein PBRA_009686 [Plasmodiophora brassicae]|uniref:DNA 3'-5' helicase n=1 Tax=Plasmodiophora brassicae TaxID=37360 RepID=A0A0G4ILB5_PLABS|nr:hypothetical protein PBRA_009686 [Plasmodiophora brassicae]